MIIDSIKNIKNYHFDKNILRALEKASKYTADEYSTERVDFENGDYILPNKYETQVKSNIVMEAHKKYIDVMYMVDGIEAIMIANTDTLKNITSPYTLNGDYLLAEAEESLSNVILKTGDFIVLYPQDAHCPACAANQIPANVKKVICKVQI